MSLKEFQTPNIIFVIVEVVKLVMGVISSVRSVRRFDDVSDGYLQLLDLLCIDTVQWFHRDRLTDTSQWPLNLELESWT